MTPGDILCDVVRKGLSEETVEARDVYEMRAWAHGCGEKTAQTRATSPRRGCRVACGLRRGRGQGSVEEQIMKLVEATEKGQASF